MVYYIPTDYRLILFRSLQYNRSGLIILTRKLHVAIGYVSLTSTSNTTSVQGPD